MTTCKDCVHFKACKNIYEIHGDGLSEDSHTCDYFKNHSRFRELPCSTSETLFVIEDSGEIKMDKVETIVTVGYDEDFSQSLLDCYSGKHYYVKDIGKTVFLTREEAEAAVGSICIY